MQCCWILELAWNHAQRVTGMCFSQHVRGKKNAPQSQLCFWKSPVNTIQEQKTSKHLWTLDRSIHYGQIADIDCWGSRSNTLSLSVLPSPDSSRQYVTLARAMNTNVEHQEQTVSFGPVRGRWVIRTLDWVIVSAFIMALWLLSSLICLASLENIKMSKDCCYY